MFEQMHYNDLNGEETQIRKIYGNTEQLSKNDRRFLKILDAGTRKNWRYQCQSNKKVSKFQLIELKL